MLGPLIPEMLHGQSAQLLQRFMHSRSVVFADFSTIEIFEILISSIADPSKTILNILGWPRDDNSCIFVKNSAGLTGGTVTFIFRPCSTAG